MQPAHRPPPNSEPGPFHADQIHDGDGYELSNGHPIRCMGAGRRHAASNTEGAKALGTDPAGLVAGVDAGFSFNDGKNLRAPDIAIGNVKDGPGWSQGAPAVAVEYADRGQDEHELQNKIAELLSAGTRQVWVVRLMGPLRAEVYEAGKEVRTVNEDGILSAPGILANTYTVRDLVDGNQATLRNLLNREGYASLQDVLSKGQAQAIVTLLEARGLTVEDSVRGRILECRDPATLKRWLLRAAQTQAQTQGQGQVMTAADVIAE